MSPVVSPVRAAQVAQLQTWGVAGKVETSSPLNLDVRASDFTAARATKPLQNWVRSGGIVILHTDAAQAFGFSTVQARERTFNRAGQLWGRGGNALPFGGSPLLLGGRSQSRKGQTDGLPGVRTVFYRLENGDALLRDSGAAVVPLLRVEDNTLPEDNKTEPTFYAAAMRRYGRGWALFVPRIIEARADGARFQQNLDAFIADASVGKWRTLDVATLQTAYKPASQRQTVDWQTLREALFPADDPNKLPVVSEDAQLIISVDDAKTIGSALKQIEAAPNDDGLQTSGRALVYLLAARALWQLDSDNSTPSTNAKLAALWETSSAARETLWQTQSGGPAADMTRWWNGVFALGAALPPIPTSYQTEIIAFSYARPALEAAQWWRGIQNADVELKKIIALAEPAAQQMAEQHQDDPPLLSYWRTDGRAKYYLQLFPIQAASDKFPPLPKDWGVPRRSNTFENSLTSTWLVPIGSAEAMDISAIPQPLAFPKANSIRPQMFWLCSRIWSGEIPYNWGLTSGESEIALFPYPTERESPRLDTVHEEINQFSDSYLQNNRVILKHPVHLPMASWPAYQKQMRIRAPNETENSLDNPQAIYQRNADTLWGLQEVVVGATPARVARLQAHLLLVFWLDRELLPEWIDAGLQNNFSLNMLDIIDKESNDLRRITPFPSNEGLLRENPRRVLAKRMIDYSLRESSATGDAEVEPFEPTKRNIPRGRLLSQLDSTHQVAYFYQRFGAGAFIETLQRLGSGQSLDAALQATTGLTERQFIDAANAN